MRYTKIANSKNSRELELAEPCADVFWIDVWFVCHLTYLISVSFISQTIGQLFAADSWAGAVFLISLVAFSKLGHTAAGFFNSHFRAFTDANTFNIQFPLTSPETSL